MKNIIEKLELNASLYPNKILFAEAGDNQINYKDFVEYSKKIASSFDFLSGKNNPIAVFDNRNINTLLSMFGINYSGNFYIVLDSNSPVERLQKIVDIIKPKAILFEQCNQEKLKNLVLNNCTTLDISKSKENAINNEYLEAQKNNMVSTDPIYALFTSGSTGMPKGTILSHLNVISYIEWIVNAFNIDTNTIYGNQTPFYFSMSVSDIYSCIYAGATLNIIPKMYFSFPINLVKFLNERKINTIYWVPSALSIIANIKLFDYEKPKYLQRVLFAGELMPNKQLNYWRKNLDSNIIYANLFGPTETTDICTYYICNRDFKDEDSLPIGKHCDNCETFIVDDNGKEIKEIGLMGELYVKGAFVAQGYYDNKEKTESTFVQNPLQNHYPEIVYKTGDLVKLNEYGEYVYMGRKDFQIKHMGYRIELGEIETMAISIQNIHSAVCIYDETTDEIVLIYEGKINEIEMLEKLKEKVPHYMVPNITIKTTNMPHNANGKIDRVYLKNNYKDMKK